MPYKISIHDEKINGKEKIILPISMKQKYHKGKRLEALVNFTAQYNTTILIADSLQKYNVGNKKAIAQGKKFLTTHSTIFKDTVLIDSVEKWHKYKDSSTLKLILWDFWAIIKKEELSAASKIIEENSQPGTELFRAMQRTAERSLSAKDEASSIQFQKEENSYLLTFNEFDVHLYPGDSTDSQKETYRLFKETFKLPRLIIVEITQVMDPAYENMLNRGFFNFPSNESSSHALDKRHQRSMPLVLRLLLQNIEAIMENSEIPPLAKALFVSRVNEIFSVKSLRESQHLTFRA